MTALFIRNTSRTRPGTGRLATGTIGLTIYLVKLWRVKDLFGQSSLLDMQSLVNSPASSLKQRRHYSPSDYSTSRSRSRSSSMPRRKSKKKSDKKKKRKRSPSSVLYTASKVKHHLNIFLKKTVKHSKHELIFVTCLKRDKIVTITGNFGSIII